MGIQGTIESKVIPDDRAAAAEDAIYFAADVRCHAVIKDRAKHREYTDQIKKSICEREPFRIDVPEVHLWKIFLCPLDSIRQQIQTKQILGLSAPALKGSQHFACPAANVENAPLIEWEKSGALQ